MLPEVSTNEEASGLAAGRTAIARAVREAKRNPEAAPLVDKARADYRAAKLEDLVRRTVGEAPPLSEAQRARIAALLHGGNAA